MTIEAQVELTAASVQRRNFWKGVWRAFKAKPSRMFGLVLLCLFALMAIVGPIIYSKPYPRDPGNILGPISLENPMGTDFQGTDIMALLVSGARYVLGVAVLAAVIALVIGVGFGLLAGFRRGLTDGILMRLTDIVLTLPDLPMLLVLATVWDFSDPWAMGMILGVMNFGPTARAVRSQTLSLRERGFIEAARGLGLSTWHISFKELLPPIAPYVSMTLLLKTISSVYTQVGLFFLGVMPIVSNHWGVMLNQAVFDYGAMTSTAAMPWMLAPLIAILLLTLAIVFVVDAMDEVFNPRLREE